MNVLFVNYGDFTTNSLVHIGPFAGALRTRGHDCVVAVPQEKETAFALPDIAFTPATYDDILNGAVRFRNGRPCDILHAWTPRESVRRFVASHQSRSQARLVVHLEDNEEFLIEAQAGTSLPELLRRHEPALSASLPSFLCHPRRMDNLLHLAEGVTVITSALLAFVPHGPVTQVIVPGVSTEPPPPDSTLRSRLGLRPDEKIIVFTGSDSFANAAEIDALYEAVRLLNAGGCPAHLIRTGVAPSPASRRRDASHLSELGFVPREQLASLWAAADVLVQPGQPGKFNDFRLPSKLPEYFAAGRPVILPASNLGLQIVDDREGVLLHHGTAEEIAAACRRIFDDSALSARLAAHARSFAVRHFNSDARTDELAAFYERVLSGPVRVDWSGIPASEFADLIALVRLGTSPSPHVALTDTISGQLQGLIETIVSGRDADRETIQTLQRYLATCEAEVVQERKAVGQLAQTLAQKDQDIRSLEEHRARLEGELRRRIDKIDRMQSSFSWKIASPLRWLRRTAEAVFRRKRRF